MAKKKKQNLAPEEHSDIVGGSSAGRVLNCPASIELVRAAKRNHLQRILDQHIQLGHIPEGTTLDNLPRTGDINIEQIYRTETSSQYSSEGTGLHNATAHILVEDVEPADTEGLEFDMGLGDGSTLYINRSFVAEALRPAIAEFDAYCERVAVEDGEQLAYAVEARCEFPGLPGVFGTADILGCTSKRMVFIDWKFGVGVKVKPGEQGMFYGIAAVHTRPDLFDVCRDKSGEIPPDFPVDIIIIQPRLEGGDGEAQVWSTDWGTLQDFQLKLIEAVQRGLDPETRPPVKMGAHCRWCEAKPTCPGYSNIANSVLERINDARDDHPDLDVKDAIKAQEVAFTGSDLADWVEDAAHLKAWASHIEELAFKELLAGRPVPGRELDRALGNRSWSVPEDRVEKLLKKVGLPVRERRDRLATPARVEKYLKGDRKGLARVGKIIQRVETGFKMVEEGTAKKPVNVASRAKEIGKKLAKRTTRG